MLRYPVALLLVLAPLSACEKGSASARNPLEEGPVAAVGAEASVELSSAQLRAIRVEPVGTHPFPVEREAVGSVSFDEDPAIVEAESALVGAAATFDLTRKTLVRARDLYGTDGGLAQRDLEQAMSDHQSAAASLTAARATLRALGKTNAQIDRMIATGKTESSPSAKWALANVAETDSPLLQIGQPVTARVAAYPDRVYAGKVSKIYATVDANTHRVTVRSEIRDPRDELRPGMLASVVIRVGEPATATAIPANGVVRESDGSMTVWVKSDRQRFVQRTVQVGLQRDGFAQILDGLRPGELAVTDGAIFLSNLLNAPPEG